MQRSSLSLSVFRACNDFCVSLSDSFKCFHTADVFAALVRASIWSHNVIVRYKLCDLFAYSAEHQNFLFCSYFFFLFLAEHFRLPNIRCILNPNESLYLMHRDLFTLFWASNVRLNFFKSVQVKKQIHPYLEWPGVSNFLTFFIFGWIILLTTEWWSKHVFG